MYDPCWVFHISAVVGGLVLGGGGHLPCPSGFSHPPPHPPAVRGKRQAGERQGSGCWGDGGVITGSQQGPPPHDCLILFMTITSFFLVVGGWWGGLGS